MMPELYMTPNAESRGPAEPLRPHAAPSRGVFVSAAISSFAWLPCLVAGLAQSLNRLGAL